MDLSAFTSDLRPGKRGFPSQDALRALKIVIFDVDGVMTDGRIILNDQGEQSKFFHVRDGAGVTLLHYGGMKTGILTGRSSNVVDVRAKELRIPAEHVRQGAKIKLPVFLEMLDALKIAPHEAAYMGDDLIDLPVLDAVGVACCPSDADISLTHACHVVSTQRGGHGAIRTITDFILKARCDGSWERAVNLYLGRA